MPESLPESFIPASVANLLRDLCREPALGQDAKSFELFAKQLVAFQRHRSRMAAQSLSEAFDLLDPDVEIPSGHSADLTAAAAEVAEGFEQLCLAANFRPYSEAELCDAMDTATLIPLNTQVDFNDFARIMVFYRGDDFLELSLRKRFRYRQTRVDNLRRVAMLLEVRQTRYFDALGKDLAELGATPGKIYLYLYKNIPRNDLELLFPNVKVSMRLSDRLLVGIPATLGIGPLIVKAMPSLALIAAAVVATFFGADMANQLNLKSDTGNSQYPALFAFAALAMLVGGFAVRQYNSYVSKKLRFLKRMKDTLFFKNLATNRAALAAMNEMAQEETIKELVIVFFFLLTSKEPISKEELDKRCEAWLLKTYHRAVDFDVDKSLRSAQLLTTGEEDAGALIRHDGDGRLFVSTLSALREDLDGLWERSFDTV